MRSRTFILFVSSVYRLFKSTYSQYGGWMRSFYTFSVLSSIGLLSSAAVAQDGLKTISHRDKIYDMVIKGNELFAVGFPGLLLHSPDRGQSWQALDSKTDEALFSIDMAEDGRGVIVGRSGLVMTTRDGGKSFARQKSGTAEHLFDAAIQKGGKIWAVGHFGTIIHSSDGGQTFSPQTYDSSIPTSPEGESEGNAALKRSVSISEMENEGAVEEARLNSVSFANPNKGWIVGEFGLILVTEDGGKSWSRQLSEVGTLLFSVRALDENRVIAVGGEGALLQTFDGGKNWEVVKTGLSEHLLDAWSIGDKLYVVGRDGVVMAQQGRGKPLRRLLSDMYAWLDVVRFLDDQLGFIAGGRGFMLKTTDGGASWQRLSGR